MTALLISFIVVLTLFSSFLSLSEIAFFSLSSSKVKAYRSSKDSRLQTCATLLKDSKGLLVSIFFLNTCVNILVQNLSSDLLGEDDKNWLIKVLLPLVIILLFGELFPKYMGLVYNEPVASFSAPFYAWFQKISTPLRHAIYKVANFFSRLLFFPLKIEKHLSKEELEHILETSEGEGLLHQDEATLINGYIDLEEKQALDIMTPHSSITFYDIDLPLSKLYFLFHEKNIPHVYVCQGSKDNFLGIIEAKTLFIHKEKITSPKELTPYLYAPYFIPETTSLKLLFEQYQAQKKEVVLTVDEYGSISGMITREDLFTTLFKKTEKHPKHYTKVGPDAIMADGILTLDTIRDLFDVELKSDYHRVTLGGYLCEKLGSIPQSGQTYQEGALFFRVVQADPTRIRKIYVLQKKEGPLL